MTDHEPAVPAPIDRDVWNAAVEAAAKATREWDPPRKRDDEVDLAEVALSAAVPVLRDALAGRIEAMEWTWHFRGPGDDGVRILSREAALVAEVERLRGQLQAVLDLCDEVQTEADYAHPGQDWEGTLGVSVVRAAVEGAGQ